MWEITFANGTGKQARNEEGVDEEVLDAVARIRHDVQVQTPPCTLDPAPQSPPAFATMFRS